MVTIYHIGATVVILVGNQEFGEVEAMRLMIERAERALVITADSSPQRSLHDVRDAFVIESERLIMPFLPAVSHRREWSLALLALILRQHGPTRRERPVQRLGIPPSPSWTAAMLARYHQSNTLVMKPAWRARVPCYSRVNRVASSGNVLGLNRMARRGQRSTRNQAPNVGGIANIGDSVGVVF